MSPNRGLMAGEGGIKTATVTAATLYQGAHHTYSNKGYSLTQWSTRYMYFLYETGETFALIETGF